MFLLTAVEKIVSIHTQTVGIVILTCSISEIGSRHPNRKPPIGIIGNFHTEVLAGDEMLTCKYGLKYIKPRSDCDNTVVDDCCFAVVNVNNGNYFIEVVVIWDLFQCRQRLFPKSVLIEKSVELCNGLVYDIIPLFNCITN